MAKITQEYNLEVINPNVAKQWHPIKNGSLTSRGVVPASHKKAWWVCSKGHEWQARVASRNSGSGCPYCSGRRVCEDNCLQTVNPGLAKEWHPSKNGSLTPKGVAPYSNKKAWWTCQKGHEWEAVIESRSNGTGCPHCARERKSNG